MIKISFVYNNYQCEVTGESANAVEMDIVETKAMLHQMPPAVAVSSHTVGATSTPVQPGESVTPMGNGSAFQEIIPVTAIEKTELRGGRKAFKVRGGQYETFGVMLYPDTCIFKDNLVPTLIMNDVVSGLEALVVKKDGKLRVAALRRKVANG